MAHSSWPACNADLDWYNGPMTDPVVDEFSFRVRAALGSRLKTIYWFGSRAQNRGREDSDYDFYVETVGGMSALDRDRVVGITVDISGRSGVVLDVHYGTQERLHGPNRFLTPFRETVLAEGVTV